MADHEEATMSESEKRIPAAPVDLAAVERYLAAPETCARRWGSPHLPRSTRGSLPPASTT